MRAEKHNYVLVGYGRWGSSIPTLGVPVQWSDISEARAIVECCLDHFRVDPSQGTHFFLNMTSFNAGYVNVDGIPASGTLRQGSPDLHRRPHGPCLDQVKIRLPNDSGPASGKIFQAGPEFFFLRRIQTDCFLPKYERLSFLPGGAPSVNLCKTTNQ